MPKSPSYHYRGLLYFPKTSFNGNATVTNTTFELDPSTALPQVGLHLISNNRRARETYLIFSDNKILNIPPEYVSDSEYFVFILKSYGRVNVTGMELVCAANSSTRSPVLNVFAERELNSSNNTIVNCRFICEMGQMMPFGIFSCEDCLAGTYSSKNTSQVCERCPHGKISTLNRSTTCERCDTLSYHTNPQHTKCLGLKTSYVPIILGIALLVLLLQIVILLLYNARKKQKEMSRLID
eukprot:TRINITY_DN1447_c0_g1_i19.p1 TRINITY_DN1447_c0_g1~~TRINITY_DN1447_c0_g1_i19.p1  ORF type:complete len:239 (+),score=18.84 TRINITY_DN1447_c0_g1_i19:1413-2129(+)